MSSKYRCDVCLDTNIVIKLATTDKVVRRAKMSINELETLLSHPLLSDDDKKEVRFLHSTGTQGAITYLYTAIEKGWINAIITPTVFEELENGADIHGNETLNFLKNSRIKILNLNNQNRAEYYAHVDAFAEKYTEKLRKSRVMQVMDQNHSNQPKKEDLYKYVDKVWRKSTSLMPPNDAVILAEAACLGLPLVTDNTKDFIHDHRQDLIENINQRTFHLNYGVKPLTSKQIMENYKHHRIDTFAQLDTRKWKVTTTSEEFTL